MPQAAASSASVTGECHASVARNKPFPILWKPVLENVNVDGGVIEQLRGTIFCAAKEVELRFSTRLEATLMFVRFETP